jgi:hypothetical protein
VNKRGSNTTTTKFAFPITTGMSFNRTLWSLTGRQIGREARAMMNVGTAYSTFWAPVINLAREPRWGRNLETPGEVRIYALSKHSVLGDADAPHCCRCHYATASPSTNRILAGGDFMLTFAFVTMMPPIAGPILDVAIRNPVHQGHVRTACRRPTQ